MDKKILIIITLSMILIGIAGVYAYQLIEEKAYEQGIIDANLFLNEQIQTQLETQGYLVYNYPINETSYQTIKLGVVKGWENY